MNALSPANLLATTSLSTGPTSDADLIRICDGHGALVEAFNASDDGLEFEGCPDWQAYERSRDAITDAVPQTMAGLLAKVRAAKTEVRIRHGKEDPDGTPASKWSWSIVNDLLRLASSNPDAALIAECAEVDAIERRYIADLDGPGIDEETRALLHSRHPSYNRIASLPILTMEGARRLAATIVLENPDLAVVPEENADVSVRLVGHLLTALAAGPELPARAHPDAELIDACQRYLTMQREFEACVDSLPGDMEEGDPNTAILEPLHGLLDKIATLKATTPEGFFARGRCVAFHYQPSNDACLDNPDQGGDDRFQAANLRDLVRLERGDA